MRALRRVDCSEIRSSTWGFSEWYRLGPRLGCVQHPILQHQATDRQGVAHTHTLYHVWISLAIHFTVYGRFIKTTMHDGTHGINDAWKGPR